MAEKVIIDTDPGIDDAFALIYAFKSPLFEVLGLTTVYGNASIDQVTHNARALVDRAGVACPVAQGRWRSALDRAPALPGDGPWRRWPGRSIARSGSGTAEPLVCGRLYHRDRPRPSARGLAGSHRAR